MIALWAVLACGGPTAWVDCTDADCRQQALVQAMAETPQAVEQAFPGLDPTEQAVLIDLLARENPQAVEPLCRRLPPESPAWQRCARLKERPHLSMQAPRERPPPPVRAGSGPFSSHLPPPEGALPTVDLPCQDRSDEAASECLFRAAEALVQRSGPAALPQALAHCAAAGPFQIPCTEHVVVLGLPPIPPADRATRADVDAAVATIAVLRELAGPELADDYEDMAWARWTAQSFATATAPTGALLDALPPLAAPHVRMGLAMHVAQGTPDLRTWMTALQALVDSRPPIPDGPAGGAPPRLDKPTDFWVKELPTEAAVPAGFCLGPGRRATAQDPGLDSMIALLEAAARQSPPAPDTFFLSLIGGPDPELVRWTAARLAVALNPQGNRRIHDESALVQSRLHAR